MSKKHGGILAFLILCWVSAMYFPQPELASNIVQPSSPAGLVPGNSGGIPYYATTTTFASSPTWTATTLMKGGGAGVSPVVTGITVDAANNLFLPALAGMSLEGGNTSIGNSGVFNLGGVVVGDAFGYQWTNRGIIRASADGVFQMTNNGASSFSRLIWGSNTAAFASAKLAIIGADVGISIRSGDDTVDKPISASNAQLSGLLTTYNNISTVANGVPSIYGTGRFTAQVAAKATVATYTVGAADGSFLISANVNVTASATHSFSATVSYTDEGNTARVLTLNFSQLTGTFLTAITNIQGVGAYEGIPLHIRAKAATAITIGTTGTFTSVTYNVEGYITQIG